MAVSKTDIKGVRRAQGLRRHVMLFAAISVALLAIDLLFSGARWFHWPVMVWGAVLCAHALYCKSLSVDDEWAERRTSKIREKSYDLGHILDIEDSYKGSSSLGEEASDERK